MESIMQRTEAAKWFWPTMLVATLAAVAVVGFSGSVESSAISAEPEFRMVVDVSAKAPDVERTAVTIEPSRIEVVGTRSPSIVDRLAALLPQRKRPS
jgi:hypothetical protein